LDRPPSTGHEEATVDALPAELKHIAAKSNQRDASPGVIESAFGLLDILCALAPARVSDLAEESGLPRTTVYRLLGQLAAVGAVEKSDAHYRLGAGRWFSPNTSRPWNGCGPQYHCAARRFGDENRRCNSDRPELSHLRVHHGVPRWNPADVAGEFAAPRGWTVSAVHKYRIPPEGVQRPPQSQGEPAFLGTDR
jgi:hypothetical protein